MEPFKNLLNADLVGSIGLHLQRADQHFDRKRFETLATDGLDALELKARANHICAALEATLPASFAEAADQIEAALGPAGVGDDLSALAMSDHGLGGWALWPIGEYVARRGQADAPRALQVLHGITQRSSAEWAIRPFILNHPDLAFATLERWASDPSAHVRRLVSEGSRPRLPWGLQLKPLIADPSATLPLLALLQDDDSAYVRRSVANHLNDIAKDHPDVVVRWLREHLPHAPATRVAMLRHASRSLIKHGHAGVLDAWGLGEPLRGTASVTVSPARIQVGESLQIDVTLTAANRPARPQSLVIDYAVHHVKAHGGTTPKVFKGWRLDLAAGLTRHLVKRHSMKPITTRRYHAGEHRVELLVNGQAMGEAAFVLSL